MSEMPSQDIAFPELKELRIVLTFPKSSSQRFGKSMAEYPSFTLSLPP